MEDRTGQRKTDHGIGYCNITKCCTKVCPESIAITDNAIKLTGALQKVAKKTFIRAPKYPQAAFDRSYAECKADPSWTTYVVENSHHDVMIDQPELLADILMKHS